MTQDQEEDALAAVVIETELDRIGYFIDLKPSDTIIERFHFSRQGERIAQMKDNATNTKRFYKLASDRRSLIRIRAFRIA